MYILRLDETLTSGSVVNLILSLILIRYANYTLYIKMDDVSPLPPIN